MRISARSRPKRTLFSPRGRKPGSPLQLFQKHTIFSFGCHDFSYDDAFRRLSDPLLLFSRNVGRIFCFFSFAENVPPRPSNLKFSINLLKNRINLCCIKADDAAVRPYGSHNKTGRARFQHDTLRQIYIVNPS